MKKLILFLINTYKATLSPVLKGFFGGGCRFTPTCSSYAVDAINHYGVLKGIGLSLKRVGRCHPFNKGGFDPAIK